jgi:hypothetical protein
MQMIHGKLENEYASVVGKALGEDTCDSEIHTLNKHQNTCSIY